MSKLKKKILIAIGFLIILLGVSINSEARTQVLSIYDLLATRNDLFCTQHEKGIHSAPATFTQRGNYTIVGNTATNNETGAQREHTDNGILAYILSQNQNKPSVAPPSNAQLSQYPVQVALWLHQWNWYNSVGQYIGVPYGVITQTTDWYWAQYYGTLDDGQNIVDQGSAYAKRIASSNISDNTDKSKIVVEPYEKDGENYVRVGPFNFSFAGNFSRLTMMGNDNIEIPISAFERYNGSQIEQILQPTSEQNFYISFKIPDNVYRVSGIYVYTTQTVYCVNFELWESASSNDQSFLQRAEPWTENKEFNGHWDYEINLFGKFDLTKIDPDAINDEGQIGKPMANIGFTLQALSGVREGYYVSYDENGDAVYTEEPVTIMTNEEGKIFIDQMWTGDYELIEVVNPYYGYEELPRVIGTYTVDPGATAKITAENRRKYIKLSGYVWEDMISSKTSVRDYLYTAPDTDERNGDKLVANVTVRLKDGNGNTISFKTESGEEVNEIKTDANGAYTMVDILIDELDNYYIEFTYNGMSYTPVPILDILNENGSKALEGEERDIFNEEYAQIADDDNNQENVGKSNNSNGEQTHNINYDYNTNTQKSSVNYGENVEYGYDGQLFPINETDEQYLITATTYNGYTSVGGSGYLSDIKSADDIRKEGITEIGNINMGLYQREQPDLSVVKDIERANVTVAGAEHIYVYADRLNEELWGDNGTQGANAHELEPQVKFQEEGLYGSMSYTRYLYASDIMYKDGENADDKLSVKMTYVISIKNQATTLNTQVYELEDYYDTKYANIVGIGTQINADGSIVSGTEVNYTRTNESVDNYTKIIIGGGNEAILNIDPQSKGNIYVQLEVNRDNIVDIVDGMADEVKLDNVAEVVRYGTTSQGTVYAGIDRDSQPGNTNVNDRTTWEDDTDLAPGMVLKLQEARQVNGNVFLDTDENSLDEGKRTHAGEERQGNGIYDDDEVGIKNVKVTLKDSSGNTAQFYNEETGNFEEAVTYTNENGEYSFEGFIPGDYYITYTWGGNVVNGENSTYNQGGTEETVNVQNYKSTIVNETVWNDKGTNNQWYKDSFKQNYDGVEWNSADGTEIRNSDAVDDWNVRQEIDGEVGDMTYGEKEKLENSYNGNPEGGETYSNTQMESNTQGFSVELEYTDTADNNITNQRDEFQQNADGSLAEDGNGDYITNGYFVNRLNSIDFGIIERARQILELDKDITGVKITLANGNTVVDAKLVDGVLQGQPQYVIVTPPSAANNGQIRVEIDQEIVQGATLDIQYNLKVTNTSELDYQTQEFYMFGKGHGENADELVTLQPSLLIDYIDNNIATEQEDHENWNVVAVGDRADYLYNVSSNPDGLLSQDLEETLNSTIKVITTEQLKDNVLKPIGEESEKSVSTILEGHKILSSNDESFVENNAEIIKVKKNNGGSVIITTPGSYVPSDLSTTEEDDSVSPSVTVTPPTGLSTDYILYATIAIVVLGVVVVGIILIKKYVISKD